MKNNIISVMPPTEDMPKSVKTAISKIWKKIPDNVSDICYTYGAICFSPRVLTRDLIVHESVHTTQQGGKIDEWWERYGDDVEFRYSQELEAYRAQYKYILAQTNKSTAFNHAKRFAGDMSSAMYGDMCTYNRALQDILHK
jgi:hypothetical protein